MRLLLLSLSLLLALPATAGLLVTDISGKAEVAGKGPVTMLAELPAGAQLTLGPEARLVAVDLTSGREFILKGNARYLVAADGPKTAAGKPVEAQPLPSRNLPEIKVATGKVAQASIVMRSVRKRNVPVPLAPSRTVVISSTPAFHWEGVEGATAYRLTLTSPEGTAVWESSPATSGVTLPADRSLPAGEGYSWRIEAMGQDGRVISDASTRFSIASADVIKRLTELKPSPQAAFSRRVLYAAQLREAGATADARELWKMLAQERPEDEVLRALAE
jgi:hypothetical protein